MHVRDLKIFESTNAVLFHFDHLIIFLFKSFSRFQLRGQIELSTMRGRVVETATSFKCSAQCLRHQRESISEFIHHFSRRYRFPFCFLSKSASSQAADRNVTQRLARSRLLSSWFLLFSLPFLLYLLFACLHFSCSLSIFSLSFLLDLYLEMFSRWHFWHLTQHWRRALNFRTHVKGPVPNRKRRFPSAACCTSNRNDKVARQLSQSLWLLFTSAQHLSSSMLITFSLNTYVQCAADPAKSNCDQQFRFQSSPLRQTIRVAINCFRSATKNSTKKFCLHNYDFDITSVNILNNIG